MSAVEDLEDREEQPHVGWVPRVITGGKRPPEEPEIDWLTPMEDYSTFVCRQNKNAVDGELYHIVFKGSKFYLLQWDLPDGKVWSRYVHPPSFCKLYKEYELLGVHKPLKEAHTEALLPEPPTREEQSNECNPDRSGDLLLHEAVSGSHETPEDLE